MGASVRERLRRVRDSFWLIPIALVVGGAVLAELAVGIDRAVDTQRWASTPGSAFLLGVSGSRGILTAIGGSMLAVASTSFSITISVIATASSTYGPRLVRNFMSDRRNQLVLGTFVATFVYSLLVLRSVNAADESTGRASFVPYLAVYLAILIAVANVFALVYFIHHIADSIQVSTLIERVSRELHRVVAGQYPDTVPANAVPAGRLGGACEVVTAGAPGYVVSVDEAALLRAARTHDGVVEVLAPVGTHVLAEEPIVRTTCTAADVTAAVRSAVSVDDARTPYQDVAFAVQQLVEVAVRALSPGTNDPYTARNAISELGSGLTLLARNGLAPAGRSDDDGALRVVTARVTPIDVVDVVFDDLRTHGAEEPYVVRSAVKLAGRIAAAGDADLAERCRLHVTLMLDAFEAGDTAEFDVERLRAYAAEHVDDGLTEDGSPARA